MFRIHSVADAFACLAVVIAGADGVGSPEEGRYLLGAMTHLTPFQGLAVEQVATLLMNASKRVYALTGGGALDDVAIDLVLVAARRILAPEVRAEALQMAYDVAKSDSVSVEEAGVLRRLWEEFLYAA